LSKSGMHLPAGSQAPTDIPHTLYLQLQHMGYSASDVDRAVSAVASTDVHKCTSWLLDNPPQDTAPRPSLLQQYPPVTALPSQFYPGLCVGEGPPAYPPGQQANYPFTQETRYPQMHQGSYPPSSPMDRPLQLQSHPVGMTASIDADASGNLYGAHTPGYGDSDSTTNPLANRGKTKAQRPLRPIGMAGIINAKKEETKQVARQVHQGFQDLEVFSPSFIASVGDPGFVKIMLHAMCCLWDCIMFYLTLKGYDSVSSSITPVNSLIFRTVLLLPKLFPCLSTWRAMFIKGSFFWPPWHLKILKLVAFRYLSRAVKLCQTWLKLGSDKRADHRCSCDNLLKLLSTPCSQCAQH
jgi:hypothetical protein